MTKTQNIDKDEISLRTLIEQLKEWLCFLGNKWTIILAAGLLGISIGILTAKVTMPVYTATTTFVLESGESSSGGLGQYAGVASLVGIDIGQAGGGIFQGDNILELYKSRTMIQKTLMSIDSVSKKPLIIDYLEIYHADDILDLAVFKSQNVDRLKFEDRLRDSILGVVTHEINTKHLSVAKPDKKLSIIKVMFKSREERFAKLFNDRLVQNVNDFYIQTKTKKSLDNVLILQAKADSVRAVMEGAIYSAVKVTDLTPNLNPTRQVQRSAPLQRAQFSAETSKAILSELVKNLEMSKLALLKEKPLIQIVDSPILPLPQEKIGLLTGGVFGFMLGFIILVVYLSVIFIYKNIPQSEE
ncbi:lipopolysaccharide biosynthesis protein [Pedobacter faecalis]|uniref:lipopolysaccharide biosynthesis protein n=1 Tax=Pedobacter faecalis TaxID=3041495 RepID=UPI00254EBFCE|nr:lipopolysaccharide biosynthesis protein [Pedobacter sp. ELA7]